MWRYIRLTLLFLKYTFMRDMTYRVDFILWSLVTVGWFVFNILFWQIIFANVDSIAGWSKGQVFVLQGFFFLLDFVIWGIFYGSLMSFPRRIHRGQLDFALTKPVNTQYLTSFHSYNLNHITNLILGISTIWYGLNLAGITPTAQDLLVAFIAFTLASVFIYAWYYSTVCLAFWIGRLHNVVYLFPSFRSFTRVPLPAYRGIIGIIFTFVVPIALVASLPSESLFGDRSYSLIVFLGIFAFISLKMSNLILKNGLKRYSSASS